jgi:hypothetical protein
MFFKKWQVLMNAKKINRRKFLINSLEAAAGIGVLASCDKRAIVGPDVRAPSAPVGLSQKVRSDGTIYSVNLTWTKHDLTDNTGAKTETQALYNVYRKTDLQTAFDDIPLASGVSLNSYSDTSPEVQDAFVRMQASPNISFEYQIRAVDAGGNRSEPSDTVLVLFQPFVKVFTIKNTAAVTNTSPHGTALSVVQQMLDAVIMKMTNQTTVAAAWESLFPNLSLTTLIGIKINTLGGGGVSTKPDVVEAIVHGLTKMLAGTFPPYNIIVFDDRIIGYHMHSAGFDVRNVPGEYRIVSTATNTSLDPLVPNVTQSQQAPLWGDPVSIAGVPEKFSKIVEAVDYIINVPVIKDHIQSGITFSMKNLYGLVNAPGSMHGSMCNPFIPALCSASITVNGVPVPIKNKIPIIVGDALVGCCTGGPEGPANITPCTLIVGTDPVAVDSWALDTINAHRSENKIPIIPIVPDPKQDARHVYEASTDYNLGSMNYAEVPA